MKNCHALRCDLLLVLARIADRAALVPETEIHAQSLRGAAESLERSKRAASTWILVEASRLMGQIEGVWYMQAQADYVEGGRDLDTAIHFVNDLLLYGTNPDDEYDAVVDDSEHALHEHENHVVPALAFEH
jgi:hypothetical protein